MSLAPNKKEFPFKETFAAAADVFTPGSPIRESDLFQGRREQIRLLLSAAAQKGFHAILYGERGVGKTSLSYVLSDYVAQSTTLVLFPRANCVAGDNFSSLWRKIFKEIRVSERHLPPGFSSDEVEVVRSAIDGLPKKITPDLVMEQLRELSSGVIIAPIFDEFDRITDIETKTLFADTIKMLSDFGTSSTLILIGVAESVDELISEHASIERALIQIPMPRMSKEEIGQIISTGLKRLKMSIDRNTFDDIVNFSQGLPHIAHALALHSVRAALGRKSTKVKSEHMSQGIVASLAQWQQSIKSSYIAATRSNQPGHIFKEVLLACALCKTDEFGYFAAADLRGPLSHITGKDYEIASYSKHLKELSDGSRGDLLTRTGEQRRYRYRFKGPLARPYIFLRASADELVERELVSALMKSFSTPKLDRV